MATTLDAVVVRHERRVRLLFTTPVSQRAFEAGLYSVSSLEARTTAPNVVGAILVAGAPAAVELALGADLVAGAPYVVVASGVPALDGSATPAGTSLGFRWDSGAPSLDREQPASDLEALLWGVDLGWVGDDFAETPLGDLATVQGFENARGALTRRLTAEEALPWRGAPYGPGGRDYVDGPQANTSTLRGASFARRARTTA